MTSLVDADIVKAGNELALKITEQIGHRLSIMTIIIFLMVGLMVLLFVNEEAGKKAARENGAD